MKSENIKLGQEKRIQTLIKKGLYHEKCIKEFTCKFCGKKFNYDINAKNNKQYFLNTYCSNNCYRLSGDKQKTKIRTELLNAGYQLDNLSDDDIKNLYKKYYNIRFHDNNIKDKWKASIINNNGINAWKEAGKKSKYTIAKKYIIENNLLNNEDINKLSNDKLYEIYKNNYFKLNNHGLKIKNGRLKKYNFNKLDYIKSYKIGWAKGALKFFNINLNLDRLSEDELNNLLKKYFSTLYKIRNHDVYKWKYSHLKNLNILQDEYENTDKNLIEVLYHEYLVKIHKLLQITSNGYKHTKKGWYNIISLNKKFFYRSSWELEVLIYLDELCSMGYINDIYEPESILYYDNNNLLHKYYPDIEIKINNKIICFEIKPYSKINDDNNLIKFNAAKEKYGDNFIILTENEIFNDFKKYIINYVIK